MGVAARRLHLENAFTDLEHRHVEGAAAEVEHEDRLLLFLFVQAIGQGGRRRLVYDPQHLETGDLASLFGRGALGIVEVRRDGDDRLRDSGAEVALCVPLQLLQDTGGDFLGVIGLPVNVDMPGVVAHVALDGPDRPFRVRDGLAFGNLAYQDLT